MSKIQRYEGKHIVVHFDPVLCIHSGHCVRGLPKVFRAGVKGPWIFPDEADAGKLAALIRTCPSGALTYERDGEAEEEMAPEVNTITVEPDGPLRIHADFYLNGKKSKVFRATLCRCGASKNKPYCDNAHKEAGFRDNGQCQVGRIEFELSRGCLEISVQPDGPLVIKGPCEILDKDGRIVSRGEKVALCRCGASNSKPYCDGSHMAIGFKSE
jgi:CDGSH-type Zn-finger protein/ferredoxin